MEQPQGFAALLKRYRVMAHLSQEALAERANISTQAISSLERGLRHTPRRDTLRLLTEALNLSPADRALLYAAIHPDRRSLQCVGGTGDSQPRLPAAPSPLIGRRHEGAALAALLARDEVRLLTITGPGGVGKSRLSLSVAQAVQGSFADGVRFVSLEETGDSAEVAGAIARAMGMPEDTRIMPVDYLLASLRRRHLLLVLDTFEHLLTAATLLAALLSECASLKIMVTSRATLRILGEYEYALSPLETPHEAAAPDDLTLCAAVRLFMHHAQSVKPGFTLTPSNASAVAGICRRTDGLPLALELAAPRLKLFPPEMLLARLEAQPLRELVDGARDLPARQRSLWRSVAWSYDLLDAAERTLFYALCALPDGRTLDDLENRLARPYGSDLDILQGISSLIDKSLVWAGEDERGEIRFHMLPTVRAFGLSHSRTDGDTMPPLREPVPA